MFRARLREQLPPLEDVVAYYADRELLARVDGRQPVEAVTAAILAAADGERAP